jgi:hypothetical protein
VTVETFGPVLWPSVHYESNRLLFNIYRGLTILQPIQYLASARLVAVSAPDIFIRKTYVLLPALSASDHLNVAYALVTGLRLAQLRLSTARQLTKGSLVGVWRPVLGLRLCDRDGTLNGCICDSYKGIV